MSPRRDRVTLTPDRPPARPVGNQLDLDTLAVSSGDPSRTPEQRAAAEAADRRIRRKAAGLICKVAIRAGCGGGRTKDSPEGCTSPDHPAHVAQVLEDLYELGLAEDPLVKTRYHFGQPEKDGEAG